MMSSSVQAGFPSPAEDFVEGSLDLNDLPIHRPSSTFMVKVAGESMLDAGIAPNDILIVDKSREPNHLDIVIAIVDAELTVKRLSKGHHGIELIAESTSHPNIQLNNNSDLIIWGVVTATTKNSVKTRVAGFFGATFYRFLSIG